MASSRNRNSKNPMRSISKRSGPAVCVETSGRRPNMRDHSSPRPRRVTVSRVVTASEAGGIGNTSNRASQPLPCCTRNVPTACTFSPSVFMCNRLTPLSSSSHASSNSWGYRADEICSCAIQSIVLFEAASSIPPSMPPPGRATPRGGPDRCRPARPSRWRIVGRRRTARAG